VATAAYSTQQQVDLMIMFQLVAAYLASSCEQNNTFFMTAGALASVQLLLIKVLQTKTKLHPQVKQRCVLHAYIHT
jgi:hypothetical protein